MGRRKQRQHVSTRSKKRQVKGKSPAEDKRRARCPVCEKQRDLSFLDGEEPPGYRGLYASLSLMGWTRWACPQCLRSERALPANPQLQVYCCSTPFLAYYDWHRRCSDCDRDYVFSATEQRHWYETLKFIPDSVPNQCVACRRRRREDKANQRLLVQALSTVDEGNADALAEVADLHARCGHTQKAAMWFRRAKNKCEDLDRLAALIERIEEMAN